jgi:hypothetical protein
MTECMNLLMVQSTIGSNKQRHMGHGTIFLTPSSFITMASETPPLMETEQPARKCLYSPRPAVPRKVFGRPRPRRRRRRPEVCILAHNKRFTGLARVTGQVQVPIRIQVPIDRRYGSQ